MLSVLSQTTAKRPVIDEFLDSILVGLMQSRKTLPCKYFYDDRGMKFFDQITTTPEYYLTRSEMEILIRHADSIAAHLGEGVTMVELGGADSRKARIILEACTSPLAYVPLDVSISSLCDAARQLSKQMPKLTVVPMVADFTELRRLPKEIGPASNILMFCAGSTLGNFEPNHAAGLLAHWAGLMGRGQLLIGIDKKKDKATLEAAYNDKAGHTAAFNLNLLVRLNREAAANFVVSAFEHVATYDEQRGCVSMYLRSRRDQAVRIAGRTVFFERGELIKTEECYKYTVEEFQNVARAAGLIPVRHWSDSDERFSLHLLAKREVFKGSYDPRH